MQFKYFNDDEFACPCCGQNAIRFSLIRSLDKAREEAGIPFKINSGYRCAKHNKAVGGSETSSHLDGSAADISVDTSERRYKALQSLLKHFPRVGIAKTFIHVDNDLTKPQEVSWVY